MHALGIAVGLHRSPGSHIGDGRSTWTCHRRRYQQPESARGSYFRIQPDSKIALTLLEFHGAFLIMINDAVLALRTTEATQFLDDLRYCVCSRPYCATAIGAA